MKHICIWFIRFYRKFISPLKKPCCRFTPSCSAYAIEAFQKRGFFVGLILTVWRILRCNPYSAGGYDPVPEQGLRYKGPRTPPQPDCREDDGTCHKNIDTEKTASPSEVNGTQIPTETSIHGKDKNL